MYSKRASELLKKVDHKNCDSDNHYIVPRQFCTMIAIIDG